MTRYETGNHSKALFIGNINGLRKSNKGKWVFDEGMIGNISYSYKAYETWIQRLTVNGVIFDSPSDCSVKVFLESLEKAFDYATTNQNQVA